MIDELVIDSARHLLLSCFLLGLDQLSDGVQPISRSIEAGGEVGCKTASTFGSGRLLDVLLFVLVTVVILIATILSAVSLESPITIIVTLLSQKVLPLLQFLFLEEHQVL